MIALEALKSYIVMWGNALQSRVLPFGDAKDTKLSSIDGTR